MNEKGVAEIIRSLPSELSRGCELIETHLSWVFLRGSDVFKVKKPIDIGFLDFSDVGKRLEACTAEVELNRRLAPSVYYGVIPITRRHDKTHVIAGNGSAVDWAVHMRRLPVSDRADVRLEQGRLGAEQIEALARQLASFHKSLGPSPIASICAGAMSLRQKVEDTFEQDQELLPRYLDKDATGELRTWLRTFVDEHESELDRRVEQGRVREGHGDLRLEHIYIGNDGSIAVLDCIEFSQQLRVADVCADIMFLAMDLNNKGRADLTEKLLAAYAVESDDFDIYSMAGFYQRYRALLRGRISATIAASTERCMHAQERAQVDAQRHFRLAHATQQRAKLPPQLIAVGGIMASGKTTVASRVAREMNAPMLSAERTRTCLAKMATHQAGQDARPSGMYSPAFIELTYRELLRRAELILRSGRAVVVDASFRTSWSRMLARDLADACDASFSFIECKVDHNIYLDRLARRPRAQAMRDGATAVFQDIVDRWEAIVELAPDQYLQIDTSLPLCQNMRVLRGQIATWPTALPK